MRNELKHFHLEVSFLSPERTIILKMLCAHGRANQAHPSKQKLFKAERGKPAFFYAAWLTAPFLCCYLFSLYPSMRDPEKERKRRGLCVS